MYMYQTLSFRLPTSPVLTWLGGWDTDTHKHSAIAAHQNFQTAQKTQKTKNNHKTAQPHTTLSIHVHAVVLNTGETSIFDQKMRFLTILKIFKNRPFLRVLDLGTRLELLVMQFRIEPNSRRSISWDPTLAPSSSGAIILRCNDRHAEWSSCWIFHTLNIPHTEYSSH